MKAIIKREFSAYFIHPVGYVFLGASLLLASINFVMYVFWQGVTDMRDAVLLNLFNMMFLLVPILTMRLLSEEKRHKTDQLLYTAPATMTEVVLGKFIGAMLMYTLSTCIVLVYQAILSFYAKVDWGTLISGYIGLLLAGAFFIGIGMVISSLTESQAVAAITGVAISIGLNSFGTWGEQATGKAEIAFSQWASPTNHFKSFYNGYISLADVFFFISLTAVFLFVTIRIMDKKRYV